MRTLDPLCDLIIVYYRILITVERPKTIMTLVLPTVYEEIGLRGRAQQQ